MTKNYTTSSNIIFVIIIIFVVFGCYYQTLNYSFVWDDQELYINSNNIPTNEPFKKIPEHFIPKKGKMYIPITYFFWSLITYLSGNLYSSASFHLFNIILHILNSVIIYFLLKKFLNSNVSAFFAALIFSLHPIQVESVAWISEARGLLSAFFGFSAILLSIYSENKKNTFNKIGAFVLLLLSIMAKPSGVVFPFLLILSKWYLAENSTLITILKRDWYYILLVFPSIFVAFLAEASKTIEFEIPVLLRPLFWINAIGFYVQKFILPFDFSPGYGLSYKFLKENLAYFYHLLITFLLIILGLKLKYRKQFWFAVLFIVIGFLPVSNLFSYYYQYWSTVADRYVYVSVFGFAFFMGFAFKNTSNKLRSVIIVLVPFVLTIITLKELPKWRDEFTLWNECILNYPNRIPQVYLGRGMVLESRGDIALAMNDYSKAIEMDSNFYFGYYNRGNIYFDLHKFGLAIDDFTRALRLNPKFVNAYVNRGLCYLELKEYQNAVRDFNAALGLDPAQVDVYVYLGEAFEGMNQFMEAFKAYQKAISLGLNDSVLVKKLERLKGFIK